MDKFLYAIVRISPVYSYPIKPKFQDFIMTAAIIIFITTCIRFMLALKATKLLMR